MTISLLQRGKVTSALALATLTLAGCAPQATRPAQTGTHPVQDRQQQTQTSPALSEWDAAESAVASYRRSKPELLKPGGELGVISDIELSIALTPALEWAQSRQQCDQKPTIANEARRPNPQQMQAQLSALPPCRGTQRQIEYCEREREIRARRFQPSAPDIRYSADCYVTAGPAETKGKIVLKAVPEGSAPAHYGRIGSVIGTLELRTPGQTGTIQLPPSIAADQCLVLTDFSGVPLKVRSGTSDDYAFASGQMVEEKTRTYWAEHIRELTENINNQIALVKNLRNDLTNEPAWKVNQCVRPAMRALPAQPRGISRETAIAAAKGYCFEKLANNFDSSLVIDYVKAAEEFEYIDGYRALLKKREACTTKAYDYDPGTIQAMRMFSKLNPREIEKQQVIQLLNECSVSVARRCTSHLSAWENEVEQVRTEPERLYKSCSDKVVDFAVQSKRMENMAASRKEFQEALTKFPIGTSKKSAQPLALASAKCEARK